MRCEINQQTMVLIKLLASSRSVVKIVVPVIAPVFIVYAIFDTLRFFNVIDLTRDHFLSSLVDFHCYSVLQQGFKPLLNLPSGLLANVLSITLFCLYAVATVLSLVYTLLFHGFCIASSFEKRWSPIYQLAVSSLH